MNDYKIRYDRILLAKKLCLIPVCAAIILYILSIYMYANYDVYIVRHIRHFSFMVLFITVAGFIYLHLFTKNLKLNFDFCRIDPTAFETNVKYSYFGIALMAIMSVVSAGWIITLLAQIG